MFRREVKYIDANQGVDMFRRLGKPSPATIIALLALFVALGGPAYAARTINGKVLKKRSVAGSKIKKNTLTGTEIKESKLGKVPSATTADTANSAKTASSATTSSSVADGAVGGSKLAKVFVVKAEGANVTDGNIGSIDAFCPAGARAIAGGGRGDFDATDGVLISSRPQEDPTNPVLDTNDTFTGWRVSATNLAGGAATINPDVWVVCLT
jgi:hypothetical protein